MRMTTRASLAEASLLTKIGHREAAQEGEQC